MRYPSGRIVALDYTDQGYLKQERNGTPSLLGWSRRITALTPHGRVRSESLRERLTGTYQHDPASGRATALWVAKPGGRSSRSRASVTCTTTPGGLSHQSDRLTGVSETFGYDAVSRLDWATRSRSGTFETVDYEYDAIGNLVLKGDYSALTSYGSAGRANPGNAGPMPSGATGTSGVTMSDFRYDASGNLLAGNGRTAKFDAHDKPVNIEESGTGVSYAYGPDTERYKRVSPAAPSPTTWTSSTSGSSPAQT